MQQQQHPVISNKLKVAGALAKSRQHFTSPANCYLRLCPYNVSQ